MDNGLLPFARTKPKPPEGPPNTVERDSNLIAAALAIGVALILLTCLGCSARIGPHADGWLSWDVCGYEGGVAVSVTIMQIGARLGCTNPGDDGSALVDAAITDPVTQPSDEAP